MSIVERIKGIVKGKKKEQPPVQVVEHRWVKAPPPPQTVVQKVEAQSKKIDEYSSKAFHNGGEPTEIATTQPKSIIQRAAGGTPITSRLRQIQKSQTAQKVGMVVARAKEQAAHYRSITPGQAQIKAVAKQRQQVIASTAGQFMSFMGGGQDPYYTPSRKKTKLGRRISKKEAKRLQKLFGENWQSKLKRNSKGYYVQPTPADIVQARKERKLSEHAVDFGQGFETMRTGMEVSLTSAMNRIPGERRAADPFDIDAQFGAVGSNRKDKYDINKNFTGSVKL